MGPKMSTCTCPDCLGCDPLNPAEEDRAAERRPVEPEDQP